jgi:hypothetical protein
MSDAATERRKTRFRARIHDPVGPRWTRLLLPSLAIVTGVLDYVWAALDDSAPGPAFFCALILIMWARPLLGRHRPRNCEVVLEPGKMTITRAGLLDQTLHTEDVTGASTSQSPDSGTSVAIARGNGRPLHVEVEDGAHANKIREALGIGFGGYGALRWRVRPAFHDFLFMLVRFVGSILCASAAVSAIHDVAPSFGMWVAIFACTAMTWAPFFVGARRQEDGLLWFNDFGVFYGDSDKTHHLAYSDIAQVERMKRGIRVTKTDGGTEVIPLRRVRHSMLGASKLEIDHIMSQLEDAARRTRGDVQQNETPAMGVEMLARSSADAPRAWLDRLDATASNMGGGYRSVNLTKEALEATLADPDAPGDVRVGAARVLYRIAKDETKTRVAEVVETVRDQGLRQRMRVVLEDDPAEAADALAVLDARDEKAEI